MIGGDHRAVALFLPAELSELGAVEGGTLPSSAGTVASNLVRSGVSTPCTTVVWIPR